MKYIKYLFFLIVIMLSYPLYITFLNPISPNCLKALSGFPGISVLLKFKISFLLFINKLLLVMLTRHH